MKDVRKFHIGYRLHLSDVCRSAETSTHVVNVVIGDDEGYTWFDFYSVSHREFSHFLKFGMVWVAQEYEVN